MKALVMIRVSTEAQELVDQHREMEVFCRDEGYDELVFVEDKGASAIKLNDQYRMRMDREKKDRFEKELEVLREKVSATQKKLDGLDEKLCRINELYIEGMISKEEFKNRQNKTLSEGKRYKDTILSYNEQIGGILQLLEGNSEDLPDLERLKSVYEGVLGEEDLKMMDEIVKRQIRRVTSYSEWFGKERDSRAVRQNAQCITIETMYSGVRKFIYVARKYKGHRFFVYGTETPLFTVRKIVRPPLGKLHPRAFKKLKDW